MAGRRRRHSLSALSTSSLFLSCIAQLTVLGYMLVPIFTYKQPALVAGYALFMLAVGSHESASRPAFTYPVRKS